MKKQLIQRQTKSLGCIKLLDKRHRRRQSNIIMGDYTNFKIKIHNSREHRWISKSTYPLLTSKLHLQTHPIYAALPNRSWANFFNISIVPSSRFANSLRRSVRSASLALQISSRLASLSASILFCRSKSAFISSPPINVESEIVISGDLCAAEISAFFSRRRSFVPGSARGGRRSFSRSFSTRRWCFCSAWREAASASASSRRCSTKLELS